MNISRSKKLSSFSQLDDFITYGGYIEIPENRGRTLQELMLDCQASSRSEHGLSLEFEFRQCRVIVIYNSKGYFGSQLDFSRRGRRITGIDKHLWRNFPNYLAELGLTIVRCTQNSKSIRVQLSNGLRVILQYSADHGDYLLEQITSRYGNQRKLNRIIAEPMILDMESMGCTVSEYLKQGGFFKLPGQQNLRFPELLMLCTTKESHSSITGTILGFQFKRWLLEIFYDEQLQLTGENMKFIGEHRKGAPEGGLQENEFYNWSEFEDFARRNGIGIMEQCRSMDVMIVFMDTGANVHFNYSEELGDYAVTVLEGDGISLRDSYRRIYKD
ncbi:hypothetical protein [Paenibacillus piscarius]|uniref:hypothetical protein n=1 Tax=Paenibacillus piscarius TaxID=1089681 RepID=UPI001EE91299|nr:hypothetical protein [Paenibacillus piscarius]